MRIGPGELSLLIPIVAILSVMGVTALRAIIGHKERLEQMRGANGRHGPSLSEMDTRIARLEQAIETLSIEVERNGEAQRYLTKVLAKHLPAEAQEQLPKVPLS